MRYSLLLLAVTLTVSSGMAAGQRPSRDRPGYLSRDVRETLVPGLAVRFTAERDGETRTDTRVDRLPALFVAQEEPPTVRLSPGPFRATFAGYFRLRIRGDHGFRLKGRGTASVRINGEEILSAKGDLAAEEPVTFSLLKGYNAIEIAYTSPVNGDATLRLWWNGEDFPWEPLPVDRLFAVGTTEDVVAGADFRTGRELSANRLCARCHEPAVAPWRESFAGMPEFARDAPSLADAGHRTNAVWVDHWLRDPTRLRNKVTMPSLLHGSQAATERDARDLAAYVAARKADRAPERVSATEERFEQGEELFETRGCLACHRFTPPEAEDEFDRVSLHFANAKYAPGALAAIVADSRKHYRWSRMPRFDFDEAEAKALAVFVRKRSEGTLPETKSGDARRGHARFNELGCVNCHVVDRPLGVRRPHLKAIDTTRLESGCLGETAAVGVPDFRFDERETAAMRRFLAAETESKSLTRIVPAEFSRRTVNAMNCTACHQRDGRAAVQPLVLVEEGETGLLPDPTPTLTWIGEKLKPAWSEKLLTGKLGYRLRDHFRLRMPEFPARGDALADGLSAEHGFGPEEDVHVPFEVETAAVGRAVGAPQTGLSCIRCHPIGNQPPTAPEQARSTNLAFTRNRMRYEFYRRWMLYPQRVESNTRMIRFAPDGRKTGLSNIADGDAREQFDAVWHWLHALREEHAARIEKTPKPEEETEP